MGGKGRKRREKNYRAAHGGPTRLPPPPNPSQLDALPSKLRQIMAFSSPHGSAKVSNDTEDKKKGGDTGDTQKKRRPENKIKSEDGGEDGHLMAPPQHTDSGGDEIVQNNSTNEKRKKKRKRKQVNDLRFETLMEDSATRSKRKERKKKYLEAKKKKHKKAEGEENLDFPGHEKIRFGEVVQAPPKLLAVPKASKTVQDASQERLRLRAIEAYRNRKGWTSRPGLHLPPPMTTSPSL